VTRVIIHQEHGILLFDSALSTDSGKLRDEYKFDILGKQFAVGARFLTFLQNQMTLKFNFLLPQRSPEVF
jgi:hypothetical protein